MAKFLLSFIEIFNILPDVYALIWMPLDASGCLWEQVSLRNIFEKGESKLVTMALMLKTNLDINKLFIFLPLFIDASNICF